MSTTEARFLIMIAIALAVMNVLQAASASNQYGNFTFSHCRR
jgi:hypothetical protein